MASFCGSCGFPLGSNMGFCSNCGARQAAQAAQAPSAPVMQASAAPVAAAKGSSALKIFLVVVVCFVVVGIAAIGAVIFVAHKAKEAVISKAESYGVDLRDTPTKPTRTESPAKVVKACDLLSKEEASSILGEPIERIERDGDGGCSYYAPHGLYTKLAQDKAAETLKRAQAPGAQVGSGEMATAADQLFNGIAAESGKGGYGGDIPLLMLSISRGDGKASMTAMTMMKSGLDGFFNAADAKSMKMEMDIPNLGDRAVRLPKIGLHVLQGDTIIGLLPGPVPDADAKTIEMARLLLKRI